MQGASKKKNKYTMSCKHGSFMRKWPIQNGRSSDLGCIKYKVDPSQQSVVLI